MKDKPFIEAEIIDLIAQFNRVEISFSRMCEIINEKAIAWSDKQRPIVKDAMPVRDKCICKNIEEAENCNRNCGTMGF